MKNITINPDNLKRLYLPKNYEYLKSDKQKHVLRTCLQEKKTQIVLEEIPETFTGLEEELKILFKNLISNVLTFSAPGLALSITISGKTLDDSWFFSIKDN